MALRNQPYIPIYVDDILTDEKLMQCNTEALAIYPWIIFILHKQEEYGKILLKQKHKQSTRQIENFAKVIARLLPFDLQYILVGLEDLVEEKVLLIDGDYLIQKRMVRDNEISVMRSRVGKKGQKAKKEKSQNLLEVLPKQNDKQITVIGNVIVNEDNNSISSDNKEIVPTRVRSKSEKPGVFDFPLPFQSDAFKAAWQEWHDFRRKTKKAYPTVESQQKALKLLGDMGESKAIASIENSIANGYQGLFEVKEKSFNKHNSDGNTQIKNGRVEPAGGDFFNGKETW